MSSPLVNDVACPISHEFSVQPEYNMEDNSPYVPVEKTTAELFCESKLSFIKKENPTLSNPSLSFFYYKCLTNKWTVETIKEALLLVCRYVYGKNGIDTFNFFTRKKWNDEKVLSSYLDQKTVCIFSKEVKFNCKTNHYIEEKKALTNFLVKMITVIFKLVHCFNPSLLDDTNPYFNELFKSIELYCHTIGYEHLGTPGGSSNNLYKLFIEKLEVELNQCFPKPVIVQTCKPLEGYGCARLVTSRADESGTKQVILLSKDNSGETNDPVDGGRRSSRSSSRRSSKHRRSLRKRSSRKRS